MTKITITITMPEPVANVVSIRGVPTIYRAITGPQSLRVGDHLITTAQMEAYAASKVREAMEWINVEDRMPPNNEIEVIALYGGNETEIVWGWLIHETRGDRTYSHWMPLPPPPQHDNE